MYVYNALVRLSQSGEYLLSIQYWLCAVQVKSHKLTGKHTNLSLRIHVVASIT